MFEIPQGKRVRREALHSRSPSPESATPDVALETLFRELFEENYISAKGCGPLQSEHPAVEATAEEPNEEEEAFHFRLFSTSAREPSDSTGAQDTPRKIVIKSPSPVIGECGFTGAPRPESYYFAGASTLERRQQFVQVAVSGQEVLKGQDFRYRGWEVPWRVVTIKVNTRTGFAKVSGSVKTTYGDTTTRKRSGKKRRIAVRKKMALQTAQERAKVTSQVEKEQAEREKRTRRNRGKKVKKKQKEKMKKIPVEQEHE